MDRVLTLILTLTSLSAHAGGVVGNPEYQGASSALEAVDAVMKLNAARKPDCPPLALSVIEKFKNSLACPDSAQEIRAWREVRTIQAKGIDAISFADEFERCKKAAPEILNPFASCVANYRQLYPFAKAGDTHLLAYPMNDQEYAAGKGLAFPEMMKLPKEFEKDGPWAKLLEKDHKDEPDFQKGIDAMNGDRPEGSRIIALRYTSWHLGAPNNMNARGRTLFYVPGSYFKPKKPYDQFVQNTEGINTSMVSVQLEDMAGKALARPKVRMQDVGVGIGDNCLRCHASPVMPINPLPGSVVRTEESALRDINSVIASYGVTESDGTYSPERYGTAVGPVDLERPDSFFKSCASWISPDSYPRLRGAMTCASCHDGQKRLPILNSALFQQTGVKPDFLETYVLMSKKMPKHSNLSDAERRALVACLKAEYWDNLYPKAYRAWLQQDSCWMAKGLR